MEHLVYNANKMEFRYGSDMAIYSEKLIYGRLICTDYHATGMPQAEESRMCKHPIAAFDLEIDGADATYGWNFVSWNTKREDDGRASATLILENEIFPLRLKIVTFCGENGYFTRKMFLKNLSNEAIGITGISPLCGVLWETSDEFTVPLRDGDVIPYTVGGYLDNHPCTEGTFSWRDVMYNTTVEFGSNKGQSGHSHPFAIAHNRVMGGYFVCQLEWSSNWRFRFFNDFLHIGGGGGGEYIRLCFDLAPTARGVMRVLESGEEVGAPAIHFGYFFKNFDDVIQRLHIYQRKYILARSPLGYEPSYSAHWGYEGWDMNPERLKTHIDRIADMGIEMFLVDAGWYGKPGTDWYKTVGDWDDERVPGALSEIVDYAHSKGLLFGLWIEPESIGTESRLYKEHPEWILKRYGKNVERCLDLSCPEAEDWVEKQIVSVIERYRLDLLRIDFNSSFGEGGFRQRGKYQENTHWRHVEALYRIFDRIRERFPNLVFENCASGGGRTDLGMMSRFSRTQISDWCKYPRVARIFNGLSICLPPETLLTMCGPAVSTHRYGGIEMQLQGAIQGSLYFNPPAPADEPMNGELSQMIRYYMELYKNFLRPIQSECKMYHHTPVVPGFQGRGWVVNEFVSKDASSAYATVFRLSDTKEDTWIFKPRGVDMSKNYKVSFVGCDSSFVLNGYTLTQTGIRIRLDSPLTSQMLLLEVQ